MPLFLLNYKKRMARATTASFAALGAAPDDTDRPNVPLGVSMSTPTLPIQEESDDEEGPVFNERMRQWYRQDPERARLAFAVGGITIICLGLLLYLLLRPPPPCERTTRSKLLSTNFSTGTSFMVEMPTRLSTVTASGRHTLWVATSDETIPDTWTPRNGIACKIVDGKLELHRYGDTPSKFETAFFSTTLSPNVEYKLKITIIHETASLSVQETGKRAIAEAKTFAISYPSLTVKSVRLLDDASAISGTKLRLKIGRIDVGRSFSRCVY